MTASSSRRPTSHWALPRNTMTNWRPATVLKLKHGLTLLGAMKSGMKSPAIGNDITASAHQGFGDPNRQLLDPGLRNQAHHRVGDAVALSVGDGTTVKGGDPRRASGAAAGIMAGGAWGEGVEEGGIQRQHQRQATRLGIGVVEDRGRTGVDTGHLDTGTGEPA